MFLTDYLTDPAGDTALGEPLFTALVNQSDTATWAATRDADGFITIGELDIDVEEGREVATVVVKLSSAQSEDRSRSGPTAFLLADAVRLEPVE
ncbi:MAG: hypothetical protein V2A56_13920 [bacterium]